MAAPYKTYDHVGGTCGAAGSSGVFPVTGTLDGFLPWTVVADGDEVPYSRFVMPTFENGLARVNISGGVATLTRTVFTRSSTGVPINWPPGGTQNLQISHHGGVAMLAQNNLADIPDPAAARDSLGVSSRLVSGLSGGANSKILRPNGSGAVTEAANTDSPALLWPIFWRDSSGNLWRPGGEVPGTFTANTHYWLGTGGGMVTTAPAISTSVALLYLGWAPTTSRMLLLPQPPVRAV